MIFAASIGILAKLASEVIRYNQNVSFPRFHLVENASSDTGWVYCDPLSQENVSRTRRADYHTPGSKYIEVVAPGFTGDRNRCRIGALPRHRSPHYLRRSSFGMSRERFAPLLMPPPARDQTDTDYVTGVDRSGCRIEGEYYRKRSIWSPS